MTIVRAALAGIVTVGLVAACSGSGGSGPTDASSFGAQYCEIVARCCGEKGYPADGSTCRNFVSQASANHEYDAAAGDACIAELRASSSQPSFCDEGMSGVSCNDVFKPVGGGAQPGEACTEDADCASSPEGDVDCARQFRSGTGGTSETRVCQIQIRGKENDAPCVGTRDGNTTSFSSFGGSEEPATPPARAFICHVSDNLFCDGQTRKCTRIQDVGGPCATSGGSTSYQCVKTAYCNTQDKTCAARLAADAECGLSSDACQGGLYCDTTTRKCTPALAVGAPCQSSQQCGEGSCVNGKCEVGDGVGEFGYVLLCGPKSGGG